MAGIKDVAKLAGVGVGTVSRVINNADVKDSTREKVMRAIEKLNYVPNQVARNFKMRTSNMVALLLPSIWHPFYSKIAFFIENELDKAGYKLILCNSFGRPEKEIYYLDMLNQNKVAGIVGITYNDIDWRLSSDIPMVSIDRHFSENIVCVSSDGYEGGRMAMQELYRCGCRDVAFIGTQFHTDTEVSRRKHGFADAAKELDVRCHVYEEEDPIPDMNAYFRRFTQVCPDIDGLFAVNDIIAAQFIRFIEQGGRKVPEEIRVVGYDGIQDSDIFHPYLSTICQPAEKIAVCIVETLQALIAGNDAPRQNIILPVSFRKGETT